MALTFAVYAQVRRHEFVDLDDLRNIVHEEKLDAGTPGEAIRIAFTGIIQDNWIPLTALSLQASRALHGDEPAGYLLTNVALHALSSVVLFLALAQMTGATWRSAFVAAVFAVHPLHVESVAWASERKDALSGLFWMLTLAAHARHAARPSPGRYALVLLAFALGLLSKPMLVTLPCVLLLLDHWPLRRLGRRAWLEKLPMLVLSAGVAIVTLRVQRSIGATIYGEAIPLGERLANAIDAYVVYVGKSLWPSGLAVFYPHPRGGLSPLRIAADAGALLFASAVALRLWRSRPYLLVGWLWYLGTLVPVIGLVQVGLQARADRYTYIPLVGLAIALAWGAGDLARTRTARRVFAAVAAAAVAALAAAAWVQVGHWRDSVALFERDLAVEPDSVVAHFQLATVHLRAGRLDQAEHHYRETHRLSPESGRASLVRFQLGMGDRLERQGDVVGALSRYREALELDPRHARANAALALALVAAGREDEARAPLERALREPPRDARQLVRLAWLAQRDGRFALAIALCREALRIDPRSVAAQNNLAWMLATAPDASLRDPEEALGLARARVEQARAPSADALDTLAAAQAAADRPEAAVQTAERALSAALRADASELASAIRERLASYRSGAAWVDPWPAADLLIRNARAYTLEPSLPWAAAVAIRGERILWVGSESDAPRLATPQTRVIDAGGRLLLPGFVDSHSHIRDGGDPWVVKLHDAQSMGEIRERIRRFASAHPELEWIEGEGWNYSAIPDGGLPDADLLDGLTGGRPAFLISYDAHSVWLNREALRRLGIGPDTQRLAFGHVERDPESGAATGLLSGYATLGLSNEGEAELARVLPSQSPERRYASLRRNLEDAARFGITTIVDPQVDLDDLPIFERARREGYLHSRLVAAFFHRRGTPESELDRFEQARTRWNDDRLRVGPLKLYIDDVIEPHTAALLEPYANRPGERGETLYAPDEFAELVAGLDRRGFQLFIHAIGDRGVRTALDALEHARDANGPRDGRHQLVHVELVSPADAPRFRDLGVVACMQPRHAAPDITGQWARNVGPERSRYAFPWRTLADAGATLAFASDWNVAEMNPLVGIYTAMTRRGLDGRPPGGWIPEQRIDLETAIRAYTLGSAFANFADADRGTIRAGKYADLILLSEDLFAIPPERILGTRVLLTLVGGVEVHRVPWSAPRGSIGIRE